MRHVLNATFKQYGVHYFPVADAIWRTDLDFMVVHRDRLVVLSFMTSPNHTNFLPTPLPFLTSSVTAPPSNMINVTEIATMAPSMSTAKSQALRSLQVPKGSLPCPQKIVTEHHCLPVQPTRHYYNPASLFIIIFFHADLHQNLPVSFKVSFTKIVMKFLFSVCLRVCRFQLQIYYIRVRMYLFH